jgi:hypothetical protein
VKVIHFWSTLQGRVGQVIRLSKLPKLCPGSNLREKLPEFMPRAKSSLPGHGPTSVTADWEDD